MYQDANAGVPELTKFDEACVMPFGAVRVSTVIHSYVLNPYELRHTSICVQDALPGLPGLRVNQQGATFSRLLGIGLFGGGKIRKKKVRCDYCSQYLLWSRRYRHHFTK